nr:hypothetical protein [Tanacetum cinerariifolium]
MNMGQDRQMQMVEGNGGNQFRQYAGQNAGNQIGYQNVGNHIRLIVVSGNVNQNANQNGNGNIIAARDEDNGNGNNGDIDEIEEVNANCIFMANLQLELIVTKIDLDDEDRLARCIFDVVAMRK